MECLLVALINHSYILNLEYKDKDFMSSELTFCQLMLVGMGFALTVEGTDYVPNTFNFKIYNNYV